ncbi:hypothetical protein [Wenzhouxiangella marina]|uniref:Membrane protein n=1 Tax=Wenzhouxiangella marina TaxID=1579979 RepID=A0A0K0XSD7_9GAMM|nr:hypothetical protein [Wenzhouxiangella marina]AKS40598.1 membrane protein [Wenzhouxiangella marina]MBB6088366.1 hypothetical protein [Wenzhouxiangella marina]
MTKDTRIFSSRAPTPWHLWLIAVLALVWNGYGAFDYLATQLPIESHMAGFTEAQLEFFHSFPAWLTAAWAIAIWSAVAASLALLFRSRFAYPLFLLSLLAMLVTSVHNFGFSNGMEIMGSVGVIMSSVIAVVAILLVLYARAMVRRRVLS